jgi:hypothetical protein
VEYKVIGTRRFYELQQGDTFAARIHDITPGAVTLKFNDGATYIARSLVLPGVKIGEMGVFSVRENDMQGRIILEIVPPETKSYDIRV